MKNILAELGDIPRYDLTHSDEALLAPELLPRAISRLGRTTREIAADHQLRGALCDNAQVAAPRLLLILTGNFSLSTSAINRLGNGSRYQQDCLTELDTGKTIGLLCLTELGGTNGADHQTIAEWDPATGGFWLSTPTASAWKFMPNAASMVPKTAVVTARLLIDGADQGVLPFLVRLRTRPSLGRRALVKLLKGVAPKSGALRKLRASAGLARGVDTAALPDKSSAPMDHGIYRLTRLWVPRDGLLGGDWARMTPDGRFECEVPLRQRFHRAISVLGDGRLDLANAAIASARAGLAGLVNYSLQRRPGDGVVMADRDNIQLDQVSALAAVYATSVLGRRIRDLRAAPDTEGHNHALWSMLAKPLLSYTALQVLTSCEQRAGAQGALRSNLIADWIGNVKAIITAEGENRILQVKAGTHPTIEHLILPDTPEDLPWYIAMLIHREHRIAVNLRNDSYDAASSAIGPESAAVEMATATSQRLAATALYLEAVAGADPTARGLAESAAAAYALECIHANAAWFIDHEHMPRVAEELRTHRTVLLDHLATMIDAFDLPDLSFAPIFSENYIDAYRKFTGWEDSAAA
ncbi:acyl-CoA dehydrogenase family protein [Nocardia vaccinii]|uniref:acyl-CoA dehydrogenase family protein n=1 Tax=Nocardia vaccinii TaxID=1822 RepID=UPI001470A433|nr:acyl-CoA dehydrogenase family protein [Nocardia vaccinii]